MNKNYSSYQEIERDLEILSIEREIHKQKVFQSFNRAKSGISNLDTENMLKSVWPSLAKVGQFVGKNKGLKSLLYSYLLRVAIKKIFKR